VIIFTTVKLVSDVCISLLNKDMIVEIFTVMKTEFVSCTIGDSTVLQNVGIHPSQYTASQLRKPRKQLDALSPLLSNFVLKYAVK
jgi:hypothetical protein